MCIRPFRMVLKLLTCVFVPFPFLSLGPVSWPCQIPPNPMSNNAHSLACLLPVADSLGGTLALPLFRCHSCASAPQCWPQSTADVHLPLTHCWWDWALAFDPAPFSWVFWRLARNTKDTSKVVPGKVQRYRWASTLPGSGVFSSSGTEARKYNENDMLSKSSLSSNLSELHKPFKHIQTKPLLASNYHTL